MKTATHTAAPPMALCSILDRGLLIAATVTKLSPQHSITAQLHYCLAAETLLPYLVLVSSHRQHPSMGASLVGDALHRYGLRQHRHGNHSLGDQAFALRDAISIGAIQLIAIADAPEAQ
jgi:hypothetical protein